MIKRLAAHVPWQRRAEFLPFLCRHQISPEFYFSPHCLDQITPDDLHQIARLLKGHDLFCTVHGPYQGMDPGSSEELTQAVTNRRVLQTLRVATYLHPAVMVFHSGCSGKRTACRLASWIENSIGFWKKHIARADCILALENIFESKPDSLRRIIEGVGSQVLGHCFDIGHFNIHAAVTLEEWFAALGNRLVECHLHDNHGSKDQHLSIGNGTIDFTTFARLMPHYAPAAVWTLEAHNLKRLRDSCSALQKMMVTATD